MESNTKQDERTPFVLSRATVAEFYEVTEDGRVFSISRNWRGYGRRELNHTPNDDGYPSVRLTLCDRRRRIAVHRLVALFHLPERPSPRHEVRHLDGNRSNNAATNLEWGTQKDNAEDRARHGRTSHGSRHGALTKDGQKRNGNPYFKCNRPAAKEVSNG